MTRHSIAVALVASVATAQFELFTELFGNDEDGDGVAAWTSAECTGTIGDGTTGETFFIGVTTTEGQLQDHIVGWGKNLCDLTSGTDPYSYSIQLIADGTTYETGQKLLCDSSFTQDMAEHMWDQINDNAVAKSLTGLRESIMSGALTVIDQTLSAHQQAYDDTITLMDSFETDQTTYLNGVKDSVHGKIDALFTNLTTDNEAEFDAIVQASKDIVQAAIDVEIERRLTEAEQGIMTDSGTEHIDTLLAAFVTEFDTIEAAMTSDLTDIVTTSKEDVTFVTDTLIDDFGLETEDLKTEVELAGSLDRTTFERQILPKMDKVQRQQDGQLNDVAKATKTITKDFLAISKDAIKFGKPDASLAVENAIDVAYTEIQALLDNTKAEKRIYRAFRKALKEVNSSAKQLIKSVVTISRSSGGDIVSEVNNDIKTKKNERNTAMDDVLLEAESFIQEDTWYPTISDSSNENNMFLLADLISSGTAITVQLTKSTDSSTASCELVQVVEPLEHCHHTSFDDLYFDYLCSSVDAVNFGRTQVVCNEASRPSNAYCGPLSDEDEATCAAAIEVIESMLFTSIDDAYTSTETEWDRYQSILSVATTNGIDLFWNDDFLDWMMNHSVEQWDCEFNADENGQVTLTDGTTVDCWNADYSQWAVASTTVIDYLYSDYSNLDDLDEDIDDLDEDLDDDEDATEYDPDTVYDDGEYHWYDVDVNHYITWEMIDTLVSTTGTWVDTVVTDWTAVDAKQAYEMLYQYVAYDEDGLVDVTNTDYNALLAELPLFLGDIDVATYVSVGDIDWNRITSYASQLKDIGMLSVDEVMMKIEECDIVQILTTVQEQMFGYTEDFEYYNHVMDVQALFMQAAGMITMNPAGTYDMQWDAVVAAIREEYNRVGLDDTDILDDDIIAVTEATIDYVLYKDIEHYQFQAPWEWSMYATEYHLLWELAYSFLAPLYTWPDDIIDFAEAGTQTILWTASAEAHTAALNEQFASLTGQTIDPTPVAELADIILTAFRLDADTAAPYISMADSVDLYMFNHIGQGLYELGQLTTDEIVAKVVTDDVHDIMKNIVHDAYGADWEWIETIFADFDTAGVLTTIASNSLIWDVIGEFNYGTFNVDWQEAMPLIKEEFARVQVDLVAEEISNSMLSETVTRVLTYQLYNFTHGEEYHEVVENDFLVTYHLIWELADAFLAHTEPYISPDELIDFAYVNNIAVYEAVITAFEWDSSTWSIDWANTDPEYVKETVLAALGLDYYVDLIHMWDVDIGTFENYMWQFRSMAGYTGEEVLALAADVDLLEAATRIAVDLFGTDEEYMTQLLVAAEADLLIEQVVSGISINELGTYYIDVADTVSLMFNSWESAGLAPYDYGIVEDDVLSVIYQTVDYLLYRDFYDYRYYEPVEDSAWDTDRHLVWTIAEILTRQANLTVDDILDWTTIDADQVYGIMMANMRWTDKGEVDMASMSIQGLFYEVVGALGIDSTALVMDLVNYEELFTIAKQFKAVSEMTTKQKNSLLNNAGVEDIMSYILMDFYGADEVDAALFTTSINIKAIFQDVMGILEITEYGTYTYDTTQITPIVMTMYMEVGIDTHDYGVTEEIIADVIYKTLDAMFYGGFSYYEGEDPFQYIYDLDVTSILTEVINADTELTTDEVAGLLQLLTPSAEDLLVSAMATLTWDTNGEWTIDDYARFAVHTAVYDALNLLNIDPSLVGIDDAGIDTVIDDTIDIIIYGTEDEWTSDQWGLRLTEVVQNLTRTDAELDALIVAEVDYWTAWMEDYPVDYEAWLVANDDAKDAFVNRYQHVIEPHLLEAADELPDVWLTFFDLGWDDELSWTKKELKSYEALEALHDTQMADPSYDMYHAIKAAIEEIYADRITRNVETGSDIAYPELPAELDICDEDRITYAYELSAEIDANSYVGLNLASMGEFLGRIEAWIVASAAAAAAADAAETTETIVTQ